MICCLSQKISGREIAGVWKLARLVTADWSIEDFQRWREMSERLAAKYRNGSNLWLDDKKEERELVSGDSEAFRKFPDKYIFPEKLVAEHAEHLAQIKMSKEKKKEETERERMERPNWEYSDIDWVGLYNSDKLSSLRVDELSLYFSHHKITFKGKKAEKGRNDQSAHWQLAVRFNGVSTTSAAPAKKYAARSDLITFRRWNWLAVM